MKLEKIKNILWNCEKTIDDYANEVGAANEIICFIEQLQNNWNELKKWLIQLQKFKGINQQGFSWGVAQEVLDKMKEMEKGKDE